MNSSQLTLYAANRSHRKDHMAVVDWILEEAKQAGIQGATVIDATQGIGSHGRYHAARFFELVDQPVTVTVVAEDDKIEALLTRLRQGRVRLFYTRGPIEFEVIGSDGGG